MIGYHLDLTGPFGVKDTEGNPGVARRLLQQGLREEGWSNISQMPLITHLRCSNREAKWQATLYSRAKKKLCCVASIFKAIHRLNTRMMGY